MRIVGFTSLDGIETGMVYRFYDLFAGVGGFHIALASLGHKCTGACEINKYAKEIYAKRFPEVHIDNDATLLEVGQMDNFDILCAGFPCQAFSIAGKRKGFNETRGTVFYEIARIASIKHPKYLFLENVKGLLNHDKGRTFRTIVRTLTELGYNVEWQVINTKYYLPQNRERVYIIGHLRGQRTRKIFSLGQGSEIINKTQGKTQGKGQRIRGTYTRAIDANYWKGGSHGSLIKIGHLKHDQQGMRVYDTEGVSATLSAQGGGWGAKTGLYAIAHTKANMKQRYQERYTTWTLDTSGRKMGIEKGDRIRRLTPKECERLQGFPDNWTKIEVEQTTKWKKKLHIKKYMSDTQRYKCMGNAVSVPVIKDIASKL